MANEYTTLEDAKASKELTGTTFADDDLELALEAASRGLDRACHRRFWLDPEEEDPEDYPTRVYTPESWRLLWIDDAVEIVSVELDVGGDGVFERELTLGTDFTLGPSNAAVDGKPFEFLRVRANRGLWLPKGVDEGVRVKGRFGWAEVPPEIIQATKVLTGKLVKRVREAPFGIVMAGIDAGVAMRIAKTDPDVAFLIGDYIRTKPF